LSGGEDEIRKQEQWEGGVQKSGQQKRNKDERVLQEATLHRWEAWGRSKDGVAYLAAWGSKRKPSCAKRCEPPTDKNCEGGERTKKGIRRSKEPETSKKHFKATIGDSRALGIAGMLSGGFAVGRRAIRVPGGQTESSFRAKQCSNLWLEKGARGERWSSGSFGGGSPTSISMAKQIGERQTLEVRH